jgi:hypothetical protein
MLKKIKVNKPIDSFDFDILIKELFSFISPNVKRYLSELVVKMRLLGFEFFSSYFVSIIEGCVRNKYLIPLELLI